MNYSLYLILAALTLQFVVCEKCSKALHKTFKRGFNLSYNCEDCTVLYPGISSKGENWAGFCLGNRFFFFRNWVCRQDIQADFTCAMVTEEFCELGDHDLDMQCLKLFNIKVCRTELEDKKISFLHFSNTTADFETSKNGFVFEKRNASVGFISPLQTTSNETSMEKTSTSNFVPSFNPTSEIMTFSKENGSSFILFTKSTTLTESYLQREEFCEPNELFYKGHCYFIKSFGITQRGGFQDDKEEYNHHTKKLLINSTGICQDWHPKALGLAVETQEENKFILGILKSIHFYNSSIFFTSGIKVKDLSDEWLGWNLKINQTVLLFGNRNSEPNDRVIFYCINGCLQNWYLLSTRMSHIINSSIYMICERVYNPKNIQPELYEKCLKSYRESPCYNTVKHKNFCCAKDERGEIWFACPNETRTKLYQNNIQCDWTCNGDGFFDTIQPKCKGNVFCSEKYNSIKYIAPVSRHAISKCPNNLKGYSSWFCGGNKKFLGTPDYSLCCNSTARQCKDFDIFLNIWMGCPSKKIVKRTACPPFSLLDEAQVEWFCQENGEFYGDTPDYSNCNATELVCSEYDKYGTKWTARPGTTLAKDCPPTYSGKCFWKCKYTGKFEGPEPDCSKCIARWMDEIADKIKKNQSKPDEIMEIMEHYTEKEDIRIGFGHVINLTSDCVGLYKRQSFESQTCIFEKFLRSFSKILKNVAGNSNIWSSFAEPNREGYAVQILKTTQSAAFAYLEGDNKPVKEYNATFANSQVEGFDFFVAYNPPIGTKFPLQNFSESAWHLDLKEIKEANPYFAVMGLIMNHSLGSLMFPRGGETEDLDMNAPAITFTMAVSKNKEVVIDGNVVVSISFKHTNKTRFPSTQIIRRKLHKGEKPSGVFNSTLCYYYSDSGWSTDGCTVTYTSKDQTNCTCNHLSTIALLMSIHKYEPNHTLEFISTLSSGITIVSLILSLLVFFFFDKVKNDRSLIGKNLCLCLLIGHTLLLTVMEKRFFNIPDHMCTVYAILMHYVFMAAFAWMFVEGCHLYRMLVLVFDSDIEYRCIYLLIGYGVPFIVIGVTELVGFILHEQPYGQDELCWLKTPNYVWAFLGPVIVSTTINFCILLIAIKLAISSKRRTEKSNFATVKLWIKGWISLSALLGITWLFGLAYIHYNETFAYTFVVFNGLQGFFIFLFRCVLNEQYKTVFLKKIKHWFSNSKSRTLEKSDNVKTDTKVFAISGTKSVSDAKDSGCEVTFTSEMDKPTRKKCLNIIEKFSNRTKPKEDEKSSDNAQDVGIDINITLTPAMSEAYLRNRMIAKNFSARKSKAKWLKDSDLF